MHQTDNGLEWNYSVKFGISTGYEDIVDSLDCYDPNYIKTLSKDDRIAFAYTLLSIIREINIFPIYYMSKEAVYTEIMTCIFDTSKFIGDTLDVTSSAGNVLLDFMFPILHLANAGGSANNSVYSRFYTDEKLSRCLYSYMASYKFRSVRTMFFMYGRLHWQTATNFLPMRAKSIYERFCKDGYVVYDMSCGFGGRMLGALTCSKNLKYIGCEPNTETYLSLLKLGTAINDAKRLYNLPSSEYTIYHECSELLELSKESVDFAFTCPPYFHLEKYCDEPTQSIIKFKKYNDWLAGYIKPTFINVYNSLKVGANFCIVLGNIIGNNGKRYALIEDCSKIAKDVGFIFVDTFNIKSNSRKKDTEVLLQFIKEAP